MNLVREALAVGIIYIGYKAGKNIGKIPISGYGAIVCAAILLGCTQLGYIEFSVGHITSMAYFLICSVLGVYMMFYVSFKLSANSLLTSVFSYLGNHTIEVLCLHCLSFKVVSWMLGADMLSFPTPSKPLWVVYVLGGVTIPLLYSFVTDKIKRIMK